mgnify:CR=1 FL=1
MNYFAIIVHLIGLNLALALGNIISSDTGMVCAGLGYLVTLIVIQRDKGEI